MNGGQDDGRFFSSEVKNTINMDNYHGKKGFACQVLEYRPKPWNQWILVGNLDIKRGRHASISVGPQQLPCLIGETYFREIDKGLLM